MAKCKIRVLTIFLLEKYRQQKYGLNGKNAI